MKVTVGIPFFNSERTLGEAITSVLNQTLTDFELILLDDGSTDDSLTVARNALSDSRVRLVSDGVNRGFAARLNQLASLARSSLLARMDADDVMHPERLRVQTDYLVTNGCHVVGSSAFILDEHMQVVGLRHAPAPRTRAEILRGGGFIHPTALGLTEWFRRNAYDAKYNRAEDIELWVRTVDRSRFGSVDAPLLFYREPRTPNLNSYRASWRGLRKVLRDYGPGTLLRRERMRLSLKTRLAPTAYRMAAHVPGATNALLARRSSALSERECREAESLLAAALRPPTLSLAQAT